MAVKVKMDPISMRSVSGNLEKVYYNGRAAGAVGLNRFAKRIIAHSQRLVPYDTGALHDSAYVDESRYGFSAVKVDFGYCGQDGRHAKINPRTGKSTASYVVDQHETLWYEHFGRGEAKFLEKPIMIARFDMAEYVGNTIAGALKAMSFKMR